LLIKNREGLPIVLEALFFPVLVAVGAHVLVGVSTVGTVFRTTHLTIESGFHFFSANCTCSHYAYLVVKTTLSKHEISLPVFKDVNYTG
jgi:hypothetical protein